ncbi:MAG: GTPase HflX, partial [Clostridia bacterium]|nr:GTPase HflX [Clostridia bacterium]
IQKGAKGIIGKGKISELALVVQSKNIELAVYDDELTSSEQRMLEEELGVPVIDRTALILDIFAMRAATKEGKMQVELAQLQYRLTRLKGEGLALSRQGGGIGTRGPGEEKLETDRRHINRRIYELKSQLSQLSNRRGLMRKQRKKQDLPQIALVGYTNAGKSTLLKALSGSEVFCEDKLFATLDPLTRRCELEKGTEVCVTDTVGFIKKLPHQLVEAFRSTLEEAVFADILLHVCDGSSEELYQQMQAVEEVLTQIGAANIPTITVINKVDAIDKDKMPIEKGVFISARENIGIEELKKAIIEELKKMHAEATVFVPYSRGDVLSYIYGKCKVLSEEHQDNGTKLVFTASSEEINRVCAKLK